MYLPAAYLRNAIDICLRTSSGPARFHSTMIAPRPPFATVIAAVCGVMLLAVAFLFLLIAWMEYVRAVSYHPTSIALRWHLFILPLLWPAGVAFTLSGVCWFARNALMHRWQIENVKQAERAQAGTLINQWPPAPEEPAAIEDSKFGQNPKTCGRTSAPHSKGSDGP